jgi:redox-sensitive bicupin YhaK (pirin superfamily)
LLTDAKEQIMITVRPAAERGGSEHGWLDTRHTFSFADYYDEAHMGFRVLRVINEDRVVPGQGFGTHGHRDMEIVSYVLEGALAHKDSLGHAAVLRPGEVQRITAGTGIRHSEFNPSATEPVHFYQIWLLPDRAGHKPDYAQAAFPAAARQGRWQTIVSPDGRDGSLTIHQDAAILLADLARGQGVAYTFAAGRSGWLQVLRGEVTVGPTTLRAGDGAVIAEESGLKLESPTGAEVMLFDLP